MSSIKEISGQSNRAVAGSTPAYSLLHTLLCSAWCGLIAGLLASLLAIVAMGILRLAAGIPTPVELFGDFVLKHIDVHTFIRLLRTFSPNSKLAPLGLALLGMLGLGTLLGLLYTALVRLSLPVRAYRPTGREWLVALVYSLVMTLLAVILFWDELRQNTFGLPIDWARLTTALGLLVVFVLYAVALCLTYRALLPKQFTLGKSAASQKRRLLLSRAGVAALSVGSAGAALGLVKGYLGAYASYDGISPPSTSVTPPITPNDQHYIVTQNAIDPDVATSVWQLEVTGLVQHSGAYTYDELQKLPSISRAVTLECISNGPGGGLFSTAIWQGVTLRTLLELRGGAQQGATHTTFHSVDGYTISLPLDEVLAADAFLAWRMNGVPLPQRHGFPLRALIPGRYGEENPKWLTRVELTDHFVGGLYSDQGWYNGPLHTASRIDRPKRQVPLGHPVEVGGIAFAGNRGIQKVEVSVDDGQSWHTATLQPPLSPDSWVMWTWLWTPQTPGSYTLVVRATDGTGELQTPRLQGTVPNGATGYHKVRVQVV